MAGSRTRSGAIATRTGETPQSSYTLQYDGDCIGIFDLHLNHLRFRGKSFRRPPAAPSDGFLGPAEERDLASNASHCLQLLQLLLLDFSWVGFLTACLANLHCRDGALDYETHRPLLWSPQPRHPSIPFRGHVARVTQHRAVPALQAITRTTTNKDRRLPKARGSVNQRAARRGLLAKPRRQASQPLIIPAHPICGLRACVSCNQNLGIAGFWVPCSWLDFWF